MRTSANWRRHERRDTGISSRQQRKRGVAALRIRKGTIAKDGKGGK